MKQFFEKILALKDNDNNSKKHHNEQMINDKEELKEEKNIEKVKCKDENQSKNEFCDVTLACEDKQIRPHKIVISKNLPDGREREIIANKFIKFDQIENDENEDLVNVKDMMRENQLDESKMPCDGCHISCKLCPKNSTQLRKCIFHLKTLTSKLIDNDQNFIHQVF